MESNTHRVEFANTLRGFAAIAVLIAHQYGLYWYGRSNVATMTGAPALSGATYPTPDAVTWLNAIPYFNWGAFGVALFFLISGFVIPFSLNRLNFSGFMTGRIFRIVPTYAAGFSISLLALIVSSYYFNSEFAWKVGDIALHYLPGLRDVIGGKTIDGVIWTLEIEMKFYFTCALFVAWFQTKSLKVLSLPLTMFIAALLLNGMTYGWFGFAPNPRRLATTVIYASQFEIFMFIGVMFHYLHVKAITARTAYLLIAGLLALFSITWLTGPLGGQPSQLANYWLGFALFLTAFHFPWIIPGNRVTRFLADVSYPLYVVHGIAGYVAMTLLMHQGVSPSIAVGVVTVACFAVAWLLHWSVELPTQKLGKRYAALVMERQTTSQAPSQNETPPANVASEAPPLRSRAA